uniref:MPi-3 n=1 Tax=Vipera ammodytes ammodytes TaxID=8705 RepID=A0A6B7FNM6_VIPAA|nr:MPi-3 [Vipera ammodytes ammodytes]
MFVSRLAASGLLLLSLLALSLDGKPLKQKWLGPEIPPMEQKWLGPEIPPLEQRWPGPKVPPLEQKWLGPEIPPLEQKWLGPEIPPLEQRWPGPKVPPLEQKWRGPLQPEGPPLMEPHELSAGGTTALREELSPRAEAASASLRTDGEQARQKWARMVHHEQQRGGGGGGWRADNEPPKKVPPNSCFGHKIDRIGSVSGLGCNKFKPGH